MAFAYFFSGELVFFHIAMRYKPFCHRDKKSLCSLLNVTVSIFLLFIDVGSHLCLLLPLCVLLQSMDKY